MMTMTWKAGTLGSSSASNNVVSLCHTENMEKMPLRKVMIKMMILTMMIILPQNGGHLKHKIGCKDPQSDHNRHLCRLVCVVCRLQTEIKVMMMMNMEKTRGVRALQAHSFRWKYTTQE